MKEQLIELWRHGFRWGLIIGSVAQLAALGVLEWMR